MWDTIIITPMVNALLYIYNIVGQNFGIAIILFTLLIRVVIYPLTASQLKSTQAMQNLQKDKRYIEMQKKYKDDKEKLAQEQMALYKELGINPLGSCLPTLIQFPIIIGLYQTLIRAMAATPLDLLTLIRHVYPGFEWIYNLIPLNSHFLWMDLGQPERLYIPGIPWGIPILAIIVIATTYIQSKLITPAPVEGAGNDQTAAMTNTMNLYMPIFMGYLAYTLASGLSLYFVMSNLIQIAQYAAIGKVEWRNLLPNAGKKAAPSSTKPAKK